MSPRRFLSVALVSIALISVLALFSSLNLYRGLKSILSCRNANIADHSCKSSMRHPRREEFQELFQRWIAFADKYTIPYTIACGSLLGQRRGQDMIPWDNDIDIYVDVKYHPQLAKLGESRDFYAGFDDLYHFIIQPDFTAREADDRRRWNCNGWRVFAQIDVCSFIGPMARLIRRHNFLDIFAVETRDSLVYDVDENVGYKYSDFYPLVDCLFMDIQTACPQNSTAVLERYFGSSRPMCECVNDKWVSHS